MVSLYTGVARTKFILFDTSVMGLLNILLCYYWFMASGDFLKWALVAQVGEYNCGSSCLYDVRRICLF